MKRINSGKAGDDKPSKTSSRQAGLKTLLVNMTDNKSAHDKK